MIAELDKLPVNITWQARMADLLDVVHDCSAQGACASLPVVWNCDRSGDRVRQWTPSPCVDLFVRVQDWISSGDELGPQRSDFILADLAHQARTAGVTATELRQTMTVPEEISEFLALAADSDLAAGVVGWTDLTAPDVADTLARRSEHDVCDQPSCRTRRSRRPHGHRADEDPGPGPRDHASGADEAGPLRDRREPHDPPGTRRRPAGGRSRRRAPRLGFRTAQDRRPRRCVHLASTKKASSTTADTSSTCTSRT